MAFMERNQTQVKLCGGILAACHEKVRRNFYERISVRTHAEVYAGTHDLRYAEPEFTGKYLDICARYYEMEGDTRAREKGMTVIDSIRRNMRADGYIGCLEAGNERAAFSIWNHGFTMYGITRMYEATGDESILVLAKRAGDFILATFADPAAPDILNATNDGSQHISCLYAMGRLYMASGEKKYLDFVGRVIAYCETTDMPLLSYESIFDLRSKKGIEMLVVYLGVLQYGLLTKNDKAICAAERYWQEIWETQIRNTGNGTVKERWTAGGNAARFMPTEEKPNETCVAVGWIELSLALFHVTGQAKYLDAIEKSLFNHMIGSLDRSGEDFAYYQGNYGRKIYRTNEGMYQCCRYRGFTLFSYLAACLYAFDGETVTPMVYCDSELCAEGLSLTQKTAFPADGKIDFAVNNQIAQFIKLRIPAWCDRFALSVNGTPVAVEAKDGFVILPLEKGESNISLILSMPVVIEQHVIDDKPYLSVQYGPLLLASDTHYGNGQWDGLRADATLRREDAGESSVVHFIADGLHLVDFGSAGGNDPENDLYTVFIPELQ